MRPTTLLSSLACAVLLVGVTACSDDDVAEPTGDVTTDATTPETPPTTPTPPTPPPTTPTTTPAMAPATTLPADAGLPADFPGGRIVFRRFDENQSTASLFTMASDGSDEQPLTEPIPDVVDNLPDWSPDASRIVFQRQMPDGFTTVQVVDADGQNLYEPAPGCPPGPELPICEATTPDWSPDGTRIAFGWPYGEVVNDVIEVFALGTMDPEGGSVEQLTNLQRPTSYEDLQPVWSPDGSRIAFVRYNISARPVDGAALFVIDADGGGEQQITPWEMRAADPAWSPDGALISFRSEPRLEQEYVGQLYTVAPDGSGLTQVTDHDDGTMVLGSSFSPDSRWIAFARGGVGGLPDIYAMRVDGSDLTPITETPVWDSAPDWTAGG